MIIGVDLNNVLRAYNRQVLLQYQKMTDQTIKFDDNIEDVDIDQELSFESKKDKFRFYFEDYTYEIFGCAKEMRKDLTTKFNTWVELMKGKGHEVVVFSMGEKGLSLQSTYFFLSKTGNQVRNVLMPRSVSELYSKCDVVVSANPKVLSYKSKETTKVCIKRGYNKNNRGNVDLLYSSMEDFMINYKPIEIKKKPSFMETIKNFFKKNN